MLFEIIKVKTFISTHCLGTDAEEDFSVLHLNIRSIKKNFNNFKLLVPSLKSEFSKTCFAETGLDDINVVSSNNELPRYNNK